MIKLDGFEGRLLQALTDVDARRPVTQQVGTGHKQRRRTRRRLTLVAAVAAVVGVGTAVPAMSGLFSPAPAKERQIFGDLNEQRSHQIDAAKAVKIGVIDDHDTYAAPTDNGGFCLYFAPNPRSGPSGTFCTPRGAQADEVLFMALIASDGGLLFGRAGAPDASTVTVTFPQGTGTVRTPVGESRFFVVKIPKDALTHVDPTIPISPEKKKYGPARTVDLSLILKISVTATNPQGAVVGHGVTSLDWGIH